MRVMSNTNLVRCNCASPFQDEIYGKGIRVANVTRTGQFRCTVCGAVSGATNLSATQSEKVKTKMSATKPVEKKEPEKTEKDNKGKSTGKPEKKKSLKGTKR
jgi:hypothetical protein